MRTGRLAPTPSGHLHLGNALAFGAAWISVRNPSRGEENGARLLLRIEDLDRGRAREDIAESQRADLRWLGIDWDEEVTPQSQRSYTLEGLDTYRCGCSRATRLSWGCRCRFLPMGSAVGGWRFRAPEGDVRVHDRARGWVELQPGDDPILMRANGEAAYPLAVVVDDARDGVTEVVRGADLLDATAVQVRLHEALSLPMPTYLHVPLILGSDGRKLSKSHGSTELRALRSAGWTAEKIWAMLLPLIGATPPFETASIDLLRVQRGPVMLPF
jgi:glutamyl/glutaminyl-tRNA synthetase